MNSLAADFMGPIQADALRADLRGLVTDADVAEDVVLYQRGARTPSHGAGTSTYAEVSTTARGTVYQVRDDAGNVVPGTIRVQLRGDVLAASPTAYDRLTVDGASYTILDRSTDTLGAVHTLTARKAA